MGIESGGQSLGAFGKVAIMSRASCLLVSIVFVFPMTLTRADDLPVIEKVAAQPLVAHVRQIEDALEFLGSPLPAEAKGKLEEAFKLDKDSERVRAIQEALDPLCLIGVQINPESRVKAQPGQAKPELVQQ